MGITSFFYQNKTSRKINILRTWIFSMELLSNRVFREGEKPFSQKDRATMPQGRDLLPPALERNFGMRTPGAGLGPSVM
jgi:hypothetical protein